MEDDGHKSGSRIAAWYAGRSVLVTGATGFLGKAIVEKLLRSCPDIATIYLLVRPKRGKDAHQRAEQYKSDVVFCQLRELRPNFAQQLCVVSGDVSAPSFSLADDDLSKLRRDVSIVFHSAASVRFDDSLRPNVTTNVVGTKHILQLAEQLPHLQVFVHLSTAFCHSKCEVVHEKLYPAKVDPDEIINMISTMDDEQLATLTPKLLGNLPNTYALSKNISEKLVTNYSGNLPIIIARPTIVLPSWKEPAPGWVDNKNGMIGLLLAAGKGLARIALVSKDVVPDIMPVDCVANATIALAWHFNETRQQSPYVCNVSNGQRFCITWREISEVCKDIFVNEVPLEGGLRYPGVQFTTSVMWYKAYSFLFEVVPAYIIDFLIYLSGRKRFMVHLQNRLEEGVVVLRYYAVHEWLVVNKRLLLLAESMTPEDRKTFYTDITPLNKRDFFKKVIIGAKLYLLKENLANMSKAHKHMKRLYWLHISVQVIFHGLIIWLLYSHKESILEASQTVMKYLTALFRGAPFYQSTCK